MIQVWNHETHEWDTLELFDNHYVIHCRKCRGSGQTLEPPFGLFCTACMGGGYVYWAQYAAKVLGR